MASQRQAWAAAGLCRDCGRERAPGNDSYCAHHAALKAARNARRSTKLRESRHAKE